MQYGYPSSGGTETTAQQSMGYGQTAQYGTENYGNYGNYAQQYTPASTTQQYSTPQPAAAPQAQQTPTPAPVVQPTVPQPVPLKAVAAKKPSNFDLLSDIDFSMSPNLPPVEVMPLQPTPAKSNSEVSVPVLPPERRISETFPSPKLEMPTTVLSNYDRKSSADNLSICSDISSIDQNFDWESASVRNDEPQVSKTSPRDPFGDPKVVKWFHKEVERLEKLIENLTVKTLNGTTPLDSTWKELQDKLVRIGVLCSEEVLRLSF
jgi:tyrosine-protein phosphatase non-receptor type 23